MDLNRHASPGPGAQEETTGDHRPAPAHSHTHAAACAPAALPPRGRSPGASRSAHRGLGGLPPGAHHPPFDAHTVDAFRVSWRHC